MPQIRPCDYEYAPGEILTNRFENEFRAGEKVGILGAVGSGKSLLIKCLADYRLHQIGAFSPNHFCAYLSQDLTRLFTGNTPSSIIDMYCNRQHEVGRHFDMEAFKAYCRTFEISELVEKNRRLLHYSEGEKQRLGICLALSVQAEICILDEPTTALNKYFRRCLYDVINQSPSGKIFFIISHRLPDILETSQTIIYMENSKVRDIFPAHKIIEKEALLQYYSFL